MSGARRTDVIGDLTTSVDDPKQKDVNRFVGTRSESFADVRDSAVHVEGGVAIEVDRSERMTFVGARLSGHKASHFEFM